MSEDPTQGQIRAGGVTEPLLVDDDRGIFVKIFYQIKFNAYSPTNTISLSIITGSRGGGITWSVQTRDICLK